MRAVILTAGEAARLRGWTASRPKGMLPLANRTILEHLVAGLRDAGVRKLVLVIGHGAESVMTCSATAVAMASRSNTRGRRS